MPSSTASHATLSPLQPSSYWRSAAAKSVGGMRSSGPGMSPSQDRASSYVGAPFVKCATVSRVPLSSGGSHLTVAGSHPHVCISVARSMLAASSTRRGGGVVPRGERTHLLSTPYGAPGLPAAIPWSRCPTGAQDPPRKSQWAVAGCAAPTPRVGWRLTAVWESLVRALLRTTGSIRAPTARPQCAPPTRSWTCVP